MPLTLDALNEQIDWINAAPMDAGEVHTLCVRPREGERLYPDRIRFSCDEGVIGDRWCHHTWMHLPDGSPYPRLQVCILQKRVLDLVWEDREHTPYTADNLIVDMNLSEANLPTGSRLQAGSAVLEVTDVFNTGCAKWKRRYGAAALTWVNLPDNRRHRLRGILCRVVTAGEMTSKDKLTKAINEPV